MSRFGHSFSGGAVGVLLYETVAYASNREQVPGRVGGGLELGAELGYEIVDHAKGSCMVLTPDAVQYLLPTQHSAVRVEQGREDVELGGGQRYESPLSPHLARRPIQFHIAKSRTLDSAVRAAPSQDHPDAG